MSLFIELYSQLWVCDAKFKVFLLWLRPFGADPFISRKSCLHFWTWVTAKGFSFAGIDARYSITYIQCQAQCLGCTTGGFTLYVAYQLFLLHVLYVVCGISKLTWSQGRGWGGDGDPFICLRSKVTPYLVPTNQC